MSDFASFVTEPILCQQCFVALVRVFSRVDDGDRLQARAWADVGVHGIISGCLRALSPGGLTMLLDINLRWEIEPAICHELRIALVGDLPDREHALLLTFKPTNPEIVPEAA